MKMNIKTAALLVMITGLLSFNFPADKPVSEDKNTAAIPNELKSLPSFSMMDASGNIVNLQSFKGKKVFLNIWATWCPPCRAEIPSIEKLYKKANKEKAVFIMLAVDKNFDIALKYANKHNMKTPLFYPAENLPAVLYTTGIPATYIFDENGELIKKNVGADDYSTSAYVNMLNQ